MYKCGISLSINTQDWGWMHDEDFICGECNMSTKQQKDKFIKHLIATARGKFKPASYLLRQFDCFDRVMLLLRSVLRRRLSARIRVNHDIYEREARMELFRPTLGACARATLGVDIKLRWADKGTCSDALRGTGLWSWLGQQWTLRGALPEA